MKKFSELKSSEILDILAENKNVQFTGTATDFGLEKIDEAIDSSKDFSITPNITNEAMYREIFAAAIAYNGTLWQKFTLTLANNSAQIFAKKVYEDKFIVSIVFPPIFFSS